MNTLLSASVASLALASVADARSQNRISKPQSSDGFMVKSSKVEKLELRIVASESRQSDTDHLQEAMMPVLLVADITAGSISGLVGCGIDIEGKRSQRW